LNGRITAEPKYPSCAAAGGPGCIPASVGATSATVTKVGLLPGDRIRVDASTLPACMDAKVARGVWKWNSCRLGTGCANNHQKILFHWITGFLSALLELVAGVELSSGFRVPIGERSCAMLPRLPGRKGLTKQEEQGRQIKRSSLYFPLNCIRRYGLKADDDVFCRQGKKEKAASRLYKT